MLGLFTLFGDPPVYIGPGEPLPAVSAASQGWFDFFPGPPTYLGDGQPLGNQSSGGGFSFALFPEPPHYVTPAPGSVEHRILPVTCSL
ncbi:MAG: hypothetical protein HY698_07640 [Deltaproteobacteria bacterium]|nr:hypothetical protein [Deltaproteobacteria bacterium]